MNLAERTPLLALGEYHGVFGRVFFLTDIQAHTLAAFSREVRGNLSRLSRRTTRRRRRRKKRCRKPPLPSPSPRLSQPPQLFLVAPRLRFSSPTTASFRGSRPALPGGAPRCPALTGERHLPAAAKPAKEDRKFLPPRAGSSRLPQGPGSPSAAPGTGGR